MYNNKAERHVNILSIQESDLLFSKISGKFLMTIKYIYLVMLPKLKQPFLYVPSKKTLNVTLILGFRKCPPLLDF